MQNGKQISFRNIFFLSLFIVFGTTLFSCRDANNRVLGEFKIVNEPVKEKCVTLGMIAAPPVDTIVTTDEKQMLTGETAYEPPVDTTIEWINESIMGDTVYPIPCEIRGEVKTTEAIKDSVSSIECFPTSLLNNLPEIQTFTLGMIVREETVDTIDSSTISSNTGLTKTIERINEGVKSKTTITVYPNPGKNFFTLELNSVQKEIYEIALYDISGKLVQQIYNSYQTTEGIQTLPINIDQPPGVYFVMLSNDVYRISQKIVVED